MWQFFMFTTKKKQECATGLTSASALRTLSVIIHSLCSNSFEKKCYVHSKE